MRQFAERAYFSVCLVSGRLLRSARYSKVRIVDHDDEFQVRKRRSFYAPLLVWLGGPLMRILDTGVRVLPQRDWVERERMMYTILHSTSIRIDADGTLVLPYLAGRTLATLLEEPALEASVRKRAIELAVVALAKFHRTGFSHGDAMAENVLVDLDAGVAHWLDFETMHDPKRPMTWRRADDLRALLATCLLRTDPGEFAATLRLMLDVYGNEEVVALLAASFTAVFQRALPFYLGQAAVSFQAYHETARLLTQRVGQAAQHL